MPHLNLLSQFFNAFPTFIYMSWSIRNMPYGDHTYFLDLALIGISVVPLCTLAAAHPGDAGLKKFEEKKTLHVFRGQQRPLGEGGGSVEGVGPVWGTIWVAPE